MSDTETRFRIELHGEGSGLLDTLSSDSMEGLRERLIYKLESGFWKFNDGDTLKVISGNKGYAYVIAACTTALKPDDYDYMHVYCESNNSYDGHWTTIRQRGGIWSQGVGDRKPKVWKTEAGADAKLQQLAMYSPKAKRVIMRLRWED